MQAERQLSRNLSRTGAWAFSIGTSIGWGSLVVTSNTYLAHAGPWGSAIGMLIGAVVMIVVSVNYAYLMNVYPDAGGAYTYATEVLGHDYGFLTAWFLSLTYLAILWANTTSIPLFARYFIGDTFKVGRLYSLFGYDVYLGEALLSVAALLIVALMCARFKRAMARAMILMALAFTAGITICYMVTSIRSGGASAPFYVPEGSKLAQVVKIAVISPWAFIGFENISHGVEEMKFRRTSLFRVLLVSVVSTTVLYIFVTLMSVTAYPPQYSSWLAYIRDLGNLSGIEGLPAFYAAYSYMGQAGVNVLMVVLLSLILTSLIGNISAVSRLFYALGRGGVLPRRFGQLNRHDVPGAAIALVAGVSAFFPFLGRTAIGWIVDVTTIGATLIYALVSVSAIKLARVRRDTQERAFGIVGFVAMIGFGVYLLVPNLYTSGSMARESYFLFIVWAVLGFVYFRALLAKDAQRRFGQSIVVWIALFSLILFVSLVYLCQAIIEAMSQGMFAIEAFYTQPDATQVQPGFVAAQIEQIRRVSGGSVTSILMLIVLSLVMLIGNFRTINNRARQSEMQLGEARELASRDPLTGVKSRHAFVEKEKELEERIASGEAAPFALAICDLNGLKFFNDEYGHKAGDERIKQACKLICDCFSHSPVYRNGGDEFVVVLTGRDYEDRGALLSALHERSVANIATGDVVVSAGLAVFDAGKDVRVRSVFERADAAMYAEKMLLKNMGASTR